MLAYRAKGIFSTTIKDHEMGRRSWLIQVGTMSSQVSLESEAEGQSQGGEETMESAVRVMEGRNHEPRNAGSLQKLGKARIHILPKAYGRNTALLTHFQLLNSGTAR